jgi:hypothetical protein
LSKISKPPLPSSPKSRLTWVAKRQKKQHKCSRTK